MNIDPRVQRLMSAAEAMIRASAAMPDPYDAEGMESALDSLWESERNAVNALASVYEAYPPTTVAETLPWLANHPERRIYDPRPWWGSAGTGNAAFVTDGRALIFVDDAPDAPQPEWPRGALSPDGTAASIAKVRALCGSTPWGTLSDQTLRNIPTRNAQIHNTKLDAKYLRAWVGIVASRAGQCSAEVVVSDDPLAPVLFVGAGWYALVMPLRPIGDETDEERAETTTLSPEVSP